MKSRARSISVVAFSPDGKRIVSGSRTVNVWDTATGQERVTFNGHSWFGDMAFSPDGKRIVSAGRTVKLWDPGSGRVLLNLIGHSGPVQSVVFSPDGKRIATASSDQSVRLWDAESGLEALTLRLHAGAVGRVLFSPDGNRLASLGDAVRIYEALPPPPPPELIEPPMEAVVDGAKGTLQRYTWSPVPGATYYRLYVKRQGPGSPMINIVVPTHTYERASQGNVLGANRKNWMWKVKAYAPGLGWSQWSPPRTFHFGTATAQSAQ